VILPASGKRSGNRLSKIREHCEERGAQFQAVDLRWGITEDAAADQRPRICVCASLAAAGRRPDGPI
jgi:hypothetical protein